MRTLPIVIVALLPAIAAPQQADSRSATELVTTGSQMPPCDSSHRGSTIVQAGEAGRPDLLKVCLKDGADRFGWVNASLQNQNTFLNARRIAGCPIFPDNNV